MDKSEMRSLEEKTRAIVATLSELEGETKRQKRMGDQLEQSKEAVNALASRLSDIADKLNDVFVLLQKSSLAEDIDRLDSRIDDVEKLAEHAKNEVSNAEELCKTTAELALKAEASVKEADEKLDRIQKSCGELLDALAIASKESARRDAEFSRRLENLEGAIGRIDRNTQKGFGKERG